MTFCWTTLHVKDMTVSLDFYQNILGLPLNRRYTTPDGKDIAFLGEGTTEVELICSADETDIDMGHSISMGFVTPSVEETLAFLATKNIPVHSGPFKPNPSIQFFYILDPDGLKIQFVERTA